MVFTPAKPRRPVFSGRLRIVVTLVIAMLALVGTSIMPAVAQTAPSATQTVSYRGLQITVPASWPVVDLTTDPGRCALFNTSAVYLGAQGSQPACPASARGVALAIQLQPGPGSAATTGTAVDNTTSHRISAIVAHGAVEATVSYLTHDELLATLMRQLGATRLSTQVPTRASPSSPSPGTSAVGSAVAAPQAAATVTNPKTAQIAAATEFGFDTCSAPSASAMAAWYASSPFRAAGIYLGGVNAACSKGNLSAAWITTVAEQGWTFIPTYVGLQAPCVDQSGLAMVDPASAASEGRSAADDAIAQATGLGMRPGTVIYFDSEAYNNQISGCTQTVLTFLSAWTTELHAQNYYSGVYGSSSSTMADLVGAVNTGGYSVPDDVWIANWNGNSAVYGDPYVPDGLWSNHQRLHQYQANQTKTYGGVTITFDNDSIDGATATPGNGPPQSLQVFASTSSGQVMTTWQFAPNEPFVNWLGLQVPLAPAGPPIVGANQNGSLQLFVHTANNHLLLSWQTAASHPFGGWVDMGDGGQIVSDASAALNSAGTENVVVEGAGGRVLTSWQAGPNAAFGGWLDLQLPARASGAPVIAREANGGLQVFVHTMDNRLLTSWQSGANQPFGGWLDLGGDGQIGSSPAIGINPDGSMSLFVDGTGGQVLTSWQSGVNQPFGGWLNLQLPARAAGPPVSAPEPNGALQVFVHTSGNQLLTSWQPGANQPFGGWLDLGVDGQVVSAPTVGLNYPNGTMSLVVQGSGGRVLTSWQNGVNQPFGGWLDLGLPAQAIGIPQVTRNQNGG